MDDRAMLSDQEKYRLDALALCKVLDTPREPAFDSIVFTLVHVMRVPIAMIVMIGADRIWAKARVGVPTQDPVRVAAFCRAVVDGRSLLVADDLAETVAYGVRDEHDPSVPLRFAAAAPILGPGEYVVGCVCVLDVRRHTMSLRQEAHLQLQARQASELLSLRVEPQLDVPRFASG